ncbi:endopeptidase La [Desulfoluna sp.]|uniref:endopeptidase La n=1 Tax=Desulfoluna sp. TaxID=2045199 RepID=UPI00261F702A|nr:endopeptidase La [Desulfoluna sp.]
MAVTDKDDLINLIEEDVPDNEIPEILPLMPVRDVVIFNDMLLPLFIGRDRSVRAVEHALEEDRYIFLAAQKDPVDEEPKTEDIFTVGTVGKVLRMVKLPDGKIKALVQGMAKGRILEYMEDKSFFKVRFEQIEEAATPEMDVNTEALMRNVREQSEKILSLKGELSSEVSAVLESIESPGKLADLVASNLRLRVDEAQQVLECHEPIERLTKAYGFLSREVELSAVQVKIQTDVRDEISKTQRDYYLREQVRAINRELGEQDDKIAEINDYKENIASAKMSPLAEKEALKQLKRLEQMHSDSSEATVIRTYLDWMVELPWSARTKDNLNIKRAAKLLDEEHHGLEKVKERILEFLSVRKLNPNMKGSILCFVGPPGVGKTSLGKAIAAAMKREFVRISLGGIRDEAEIRGHRRTYIGALPGRIIQGLKQCGSNNPVFMMDEVDKLGSDYKGDPSSALLEALDPEQNSEFSDHYLNIAFDLSKVMFILTANQLDTIPSALLDRMEVISLSGYSHEEKRTIAENYLLPRQIKENGLKKRHLQLSTGALDEIIQNFTLEAGVRSLERELGAVCRKIARKVAEGSKGGQRVSRANLEKFLGPPKYLSELDKEESQIGLSTGLAWTQVGGVVLYVETSIIPGKGELIVTGQLGEVMQESVKAAMSYTRHALAGLGFKDSFDDLDIHIHVPDGATPKDGPSAGIAIATSLFSAVVGRPVSSDVAMTGEITLRGRVLPIGGLKEKALGALRGGIKTVLFPEKNIKDLSEIPQSVKKRIRFVPVRHLDDVLAIAIENFSTLDASALKRKASSTATKKKAKKPASAGKSKETA